VSETLAEAFKQDAIQLFNANVEKVAHANGVFRLTLSNGQELQGEALLIARGKPTRVLLTPLLLGLS